MAAPAVRRAVQDDQSPFACCGLHPRRFAHQRHVHFPQGGQQGADAVFAHALLLGRESLQEVEGQRTRAEREKSLQLTYHRSPCVVASQSVKLSVLDGGRIGVPRVRCRRAHRVVVRIQEQRRSCGVEPLGPCPDIVRKPFGRRSALGEECVEQVCRARLVA